MAVGWLFVVQQSIQSERKNVNMIISSNNGISFVCGYMEVVGCV